MKQCPICKSNMEMISIFDSVPISSAQLYDSFNSIEKIKMDIGICKNCDHISNFNYIPSIYTESSYITKKAISSTMNKNLENIINFLNVSNISILEIGSGSGEIANYYSNNKCIVTTVDPCIDNYENKKIIHHKRFFDESFPYVKYDLIIARHILEHTDDPINFLKLCKSRIKHNGQIYIEVPNVESTLNNQILTDFFNDHVQHFSNNSLDLCASLASLTIKNKLNLLNNSHVGILLSPRKTIKFNDSIETAKFKYNKILASLTKDFTIYGAGAHAVTFVGILPNELKDKIVAIHDRDNNKTNKFIPGSDIPISLPTKIKTDIIVNTSILYRSEVETYLRSELNFTGEIINL